MDAENRPRRGHLVAEVKFTVKMDNRDEVSAYTAGKVVVRRQAGRLRALESGPSESKSIWTGLRRCNLLSEPVFPIPWRPD